MAIPNDKARIEKMKEYKGGNLPSPIIPITGTAFGIIAQWGTRHLLKASGGSQSSPSGLDGLLAWISVLPCVSGLFFAEFVLGAAARSTSTRASFSPAVAAATEQPLAVVEANRIHQNHMENLCVIAPLAAAVSIQDAHTAMACTIAWVASRIVYRLGYQYQANPFWRICGVSAAMAQSAICAWTLVAGTN